ncbi:cell wall-binding repeat-containing protein [Clostridium coskatii]|nr:cell wall-binding repeat-containing protein [Clostridium coskatii]
MQKKSKKVLSACSIASLLVTTTAVSANVKAADSGINRVGGANRYETATKVADSGWTSSDYAIVANGEGYADALCATPLAKANNAPILLTTGDSSNSLEQNELNELKKLNVKHVIVIGGTGVVPDSILNSIKGQVPDVERIGGQDRYETSAKIAEKLGTPTKAVIASGEGYADALSAGPAAAINGMPILLSRAGSLPGAISSYLNAHSQITQTYVIGGTASISDSILNSLPSAKRLGGQTRYDTNVAVLKEFASSFKFNSIYAALGDGPLGNEFADALTGGALAAKLGNPLVITGKTISSSTASFLKEKGFTNSTLTVLGGTASIPDSVASDIKGDIGNSSTPGGGSSGGSSTTGTDLTSSLKSGSGVLATAYEKYRDKINKNSQYSQYFTVDNNSSELNDTSYVNIDLTSRSSEINSIKDVFTKAKIRYAINSSGIITNTTQFNNDITKINDKLKSNFGNVTINNGGLLTFLGTLGSQYFDTNGLKADKIQAVIQSHPEDTTGARAYTDFQNEVNNQVDKYFTENAAGKSLASETPKLIYDDLYQLNEIYDINNSKIMFNVSDGTYKAVQELVNNFILPNYDSNYNGGTYRVYLNGGDYVNVKVNPASTSSAE